MVCFLLALPHFALPFLGTYRPPAASLYLLVWAGLACLAPAGVRIRARDDTGLRWKLLVFLSYGLLSAIFGYWELAEANRLTLHLTAGNVSYLDVAAQRLFQLGLAILAFEVVRLTRVQPVELMRWWLIGMAIAVGLHVLIFLGSSDPLQQRAGIFTEGNLGGLYYLLSVFVAREYGRRGHRRAGLATAWLAVGGILMAGSSAAILLLALTLGLVHVISAPSAGARLRRSLVTVGAVASIGAVMYGTGSDFGIAEKLFEEEVTSQSFSRIDRLASIGTAIELFLQSPWVGNGLQTYGFLANEYLDGPLLAIYDDGFRRIPNNIYAELAAEMGIVGLLLFGAFLLALMRRIALSPQDGGRNLLGGVIAVLGYWLAFPTYSVVFVWAFFGLAMATVRGGRTHAIQRSVRPARRVGPPRVPPPALPIAARRTDS